VQSTTRGCQLHPSCLTLAGPRPALTQERGDLRRSPSRSERQLSATWFHQLFGFDETDWATTRSRFRIEGERLTSLANGRTFGVGRFSTPSLGELRKATEGLEQSPGTLDLPISHEVIGDVLSLHALPENEGATFQAASQFNCLEFVSPHVTPEDGVTGYAEDRTQGPSCALAAAAGTVYRNYLVPARGDFGQTHDRQLENLHGITSQLPGIEVRNGYTFVDLDALRALGAFDRESLVDSVRVGFQSRVGVTFASRWQEPATPTHVSQAYCSAVSCAYQREVPLDAWRPLATIALDAAYEATLRAAALDRAAGRGSGKVWLTLLGGGVFGNRSDWITAAIARALVRCRGLDLDVRLGHYRRLDPAVVAKLEGRAD